MIAVVQFCTFSLGQSKCKLCFAILTTAKRKKRANRPDVMMYLTEKSESNIVFRQRDLEYKNKALEVETKLKQAALALEQKKLELQEKQINMQFEMLKSFITGSSKQNN